jgi:NAD(P)H-dependent FMN reductase
MFKLNIVVGSTREGRAGQEVMEWVQKRAEAHGDFEVTVLDLRDWPLPMFAETFATVGDFSNPTYSDPIVRAWNAQVAEGDAFIFITPEYNHSFSGVLKNAIDSVFVSWAFRNKPAAFVSYSGSAVGGARAVEQLALVVTEAEMVPLRNSVLVGAVGSAFDPAGQPTSPMSEFALTILLDDLAWWAKATQQARAEGELKPGALRFRELVSELG